MEKWLVSTRTDNDALYLLIRVGRLVKLGNRRDEGGRQWAEVQLFGQKLDAVAARFGVERVGRRVNLKSLWLAHDFLICTHAFRRKKLFLAVLQKHTGGGCMRHVFARVDPGVLRHESVVSFRPDFQPMFLLFF